MVTEIDNNGSSSPRPWVFPVILAGLLCLVLAWRMVPRPEGPAAPVLPPAEAGAGVLVAIEPGDTPRVESLVPVASGDALAVLRVAGKDLEAFRPEFVGQGASAFVDAIGGIANEGPHGRNWTFEVNGEPGDRSAAITPVESGDSVLWKFTLGE